MYIKFLLRTGALVLAGFSTVYGMSYEMVLAQSVQAGNVQLAPGTYTVSQKNGNALFTDWNTDRMYSVPVTVQHLDRKNEILKVKIDNTNGARRIQQIDLAGKAIQLNFGD